MCKSYFSHFLSSKLFNQGWCWRQRWRVVVGVGRWEEWEERRAKKKSESSQRLNFRQTDFERWERQRSRETGREGVWDNSTEQRQAERNTYRGKQRERERERERVGGRETSTEREREIDAQRHTYFMYSPLFRDFYKIRDIRGFWAKVQKLQWYKG